MATEGFLSLACHWAPESLSLSLSLSLHAHTRHCHTQANRTCEKSCAHNIDSSAPLPPPLAFTHSPQRALPCPGAA
jgi:hypothetical protein